uniref:NEDD8 ultimate buster 1-like n=1 Tax=Pristiophorus japonicus TaxID=55135 RepID=UPI00398F4E19
MAEGRQTVVRQQEEDPGNTMESGVGLSQEQACSSSGQQDIWVMLPKQLQENEKKMKITISPNASVHHLCLEIRKKLPNDECKNIELVHKGKNLIKDKTLNEQNVKNKGTVMLMLVNKDNREQTAFVSRIKKGAELLAKQDEDFEKPYLKIVDQNGEIIEVPEEEKVVILTALILHEVGRSNMKKGDYVRALVFLDFAENEFRKCDEVHLNSIDNYGVLNLDVIWCNLQIQNIQFLHDARKRLEKAQSYFNNCFGKNQERLQKLKDDSGRHKILFLRLYVLWGVWFYHNKLEKDALRDLKKAEDLLKELSVNDCLLGCLMNQGFTSHEARLALRATGGGDIGKAKLYIEARRERARQQTIEAEKRREGLRRPMEVDHPEQAVSEENRTPGQAGQVSLPSANPVPSAGAGVPSPPGGTSTSTTPSGPPVREGAPSPPGKTTPSASSPSATSAATDAQGNPEQDDMLKEILAYLPQDEDDYIDLSLEEEEDVIDEYKAKLNKNGTKD